MIVPTMFFNEVMKELERDAPSLKSKAAHLHRFYVMQMQRNPGQKQATHVEEHISTGRNKWLIITKIQRNGDINSHFVLMYYDNDGLKCISHSPDPQTVLIYLYEGHFFTRYNERQLLNKVKPEDIVRSFFKNDWTPVTGEFELTQIPGVKQVYVVLKKGVAIGWRVPKRDIVHIKTFVNDELLTPQQMEVVQQLRRNELPKESLTMPRKVLDHAIMHLLELCKMYNIEPPPLPKAEDKEQKEE